jgi:hypothetical protein
MDNAIDQLLAEMDVFGATRTTIRYPGKGVVVLVCRGADADYLDRVLDAWDQGDCGFADDEEDSQ